MASLDIESRQIASPAALRAELENDIADLRAEIHREFGSTRRTFTTWMLTQPLAIIAAMTASSS